MFIPKSDEEMRAVLERHFTNIQGIDHTIAGKVMAKLEDCSTATQSATFSLQVTQEFQNPRGFMHGGVTAILFDHTMGVLIKCCRADGKFGPTVNLNVSYHRPIRVGEKLYIRTRVISAGKTMIHTAGECWQDDERKLCATATGIFYLDP